MAVPAGELGSGEEGEGDDFTVQGPAPLEVTELAAPAAPGDLSFLLEPRTIFSASLTVSVHPALAAGSPGS